MTWGNALAVFAGALVGQSVGAGLSELAWCGAGAMAGYFVRQEKP